MGSSGQSVLRRVRAEPPHAQRSVLTSVVRAIMPEDPGLPDARGEIDVTVNIQLSVGERQSSRTEDARAHPPWSQMIHGSVLSALAGAVREPFWPTFSNAQKKSVSLGCPARLTGMLPAKLRGSEPVMFGSVCVTSKSAVIVWLV